MNWIKSSGLLLLLFLLVSVTIEQPKVKNFHRVNDELFRSGQPNGSGMKQLESMGVKSVLNLRNSFGNERELKGTGLNRIHVPMKAKQIDIEDVIQALREIKNAEKPVLVHCYHGSDRTGCIVAAYRMVIGKWTKLTAIAEFKTEEYGYNDKLFPNILTLLEGMNVEMVRKEVMSAE